MERFRDPHYLQGEQYKDGARLTVRANLHERFSVAPIDWMDWVFQYVDDSGAKEILEVGTGTGKLWAGREQFLTSQQRVLLSDFSRGILKDAKANIDKRGPFLFAGINAQELPLAGDSLDMVIANHMLYHLPDLEAGLREFARVLRADGRLLCATNGREHMKEIALWAQEALDPEKETSNYLKAWEEGIGGFSVENGADKLGKYFRRVDYFPYEDKLVINDPQAIVDFLISSSLHKVNEQEQEILLTFLAKKLSSSRKLEVQKDSGIFIAKIPVH